MKALVRTMGSENEVVRGYFGFGAAFAQLPVCQYIYEAQLYILQVHVHLGHFTARKLFK